MATHLALHDAFLNQKISVLKPRIAHCLPPAGSVWDAIKLFTSAKVGCILIMDDTDNIKGIFTERDLIKKYSQERDLKTIKLPEVMSVPVEHVRSVASIARLIHTFCSHGIRHVVVIDKRSSPPHILSARDLLDHVYRSITADMPTSTLTKVAELDDVAKFFNTPASSTITQKPVCLPEAASVAQAIMEMQTSRVGICLITNHHNFPIGIFGERDLISRVLTLGLDPEKTRLGEVMTKDPITLNEHAPLSKVLNLMAVKGFRNVPLLNAENQLTAVVSLMEIIKTLGKHA